MTDFQNIKFEKKNQIAYVTIDRPKVLNALNMATMQELKEAFASIKDDSEVRVAILTGAGEKAFVAGADIGELSQQTPVSAKEYTHRGQAIVDAIENLGKPVIACINGFALGGGCELAMACTMRLASDNAKLGQPEVKLGLIPGYGGTQRLSRLVGKGLAMQQILTGEMITAQEAYRIGLVNEVVPQADLIARAEAFAAKIIANAPLAIQYAMEAVNRGFDLTLADGCFSRPRCSPSAAPPRTRTKAREPSWRSGQRSSKGSNKRCCLLRDGAWELCRPYRSLCRNWYRRYAARSFSFLDRLSQHWVTNDYIYFGGWRICACWLSANDGARVGYSQLDEGTDEI